MPVLLKLSGITREDYTHRWVVRNNYYETVVGQSR